MLNGPISPAASSTRLASSSGSPDVHSVSSRLRSVAATSPFAPSSPAGGALSVVVLAAAAASRPPPRLTQGRGTKAIGTRAVTAMKKAV